MASSQTQEKSKWPILKKLLLLLKPELKDYWILIAYASILGVLSLAVPVAVQSFVNTVAFGSLFQPVLVLAIFLLVVLGFSAVIQALNYFTLEILNRRLSVRFTLHLAKQIPILSQGGSRAVDASNRYFELSYFQKILTPIVLDGFGIVLQTLVGLILLAFYHPVFLAFDILIVIAIVFVMFPLAPKGIQHSIAESSLKYEIGGWFQSLAMNASAFRTRQSQDFVSEHTNQLAHRLLDVREKAFFYPFLQNIGALVIFAIGSALLLGLGGYLVMKEQLTLGQLVAAEIVVSSILGGVAKFGSKLGSFYDLLASAKKMEALFPHDSESSEQGFQLPEGFEGRALSVNFDMSAIDPSVPHLVAQFPPGTWTQMSSWPENISETFQSSLLGNLKGRSEFTVDGISSSLLSKGVWIPYVLDLSGIQVFNTDLKGNLFLNSVPDAKLTNDVLESLGLLKVVNSWSEGLGSQLFFDQEDLSFSLKLKFAVARSIFAKPNFLILSDNFCRCLPGKLDEVLSVIQRFCPDSTVIVFSDTAPKEGLFDSRISLEAGQWKIK